MFMTNEELVEELYHKAHVKGFFHELHDKVSELKKTTKIKCNHLIIREAYDKLKETRKRNE